MTRNEKAGLAIGSAVVVGAAVFAATRPAAAAGGGTNTGGGTAGGGTNTGGGTAGGGTNTGGVTYTPGGAGPANVDAGTLPAAPLPSPVGGTTVASDPAIARAQTELLDLGYDVGPRRVDGVWGPDTQAAAVAFQTGHGSTAPQRYFSDELAQAIHAVWLNRGASAGDNAGTGDATAPVSGLGGLGDFDEDEHGYSLHPHAAVARLLNPFRRY